MWSLWIDLLSETTAYFRMRGNFVDYMVKVAWVKPMLGFNHVTV